MSSRNPTQVQPFRDREIERSLSEAAEIGAAVLQRHFGKIRQIDKKGEIDLVTKADQECEAKVLRYLRKRHPDHRFVAEESWDFREADLTGYTWFIDPLDGTTNYAHGLEHYSISIGVALDGKPVAGLIADPERGHLYRAFRGRGAFRNRTRLNVSANATLNDSIVATGFPYDRRKRVRELTAIVGAFLLRSQGVRRMGVASLDLAMTAAGQFDGYYESPLKPWDVAAGIVLVNEAGGKVTNEQGEPVDLLHPSILASNGAIHDEMIRVIRDTREELGIGT